MRDHGGNLDAAMARYGGTRGEWLDLSTGINPRPYPLPAIPESAWATLPTAAELEALSKAAARAYGSAAAVVPVAGAQAAIQIVPLVVTRRLARVLEPTYNEHAAALRAAGWSVEGVPDTAALAGADLAVVVNPNNPDGRRHAPADLRALSTRVGLLVVDESFADAEPELSLGGAIPDNTLLLRSFGKFYGLAGLRLGFVLAGSRLAERVRELAGPWPVSGPAIAVGRAALADEGWRQDSVARLALDAARLDALAVNFGWHVVGGTTLFRLYETENAAAEQAQLAGVRIWCRRFPYSHGWLRLGLPDGDGWAHLKAALG